MAIKYSLCFDCIVNLHHKTVTSQESGGLKTLKKHIVKKILKKHHSYFPWSIRIYHIHTQQIFQII